MKRKILVLMSMGVSVFLAGCTEVPLCIENGTRTVVSVGGCSRSGRCGTTYDNGTTDTSLRPTIGEKQMYCTKRK